MVCSRSLSRVVGKGNVTSSQKTWTDPNELILLTDESDVHVRVSRVEGSERQGWGFG